MIKKVKPAAQIQKEKKSWMAGTMAAVVLLCALSAVYVSGARSIQVAAKKRELPIYCVERSDNRIAISFDASWGGDQTEKLLDILDEYGVRTTFFLVDIWTQKFPDLVKEIVARGHEIGNHSTTHPHMTSLSREKIRQELDTQARHVEALTGVRPRLFRPPYGDYDNKVVETARAEGYEVIQWSVDSLDWKNKGPEDMIRRATQSIRSGDIVLFHNDSKYILHALPAILKSYQEQGLTVVPVSELLLPGKTTIDVQGRQRPAAETVPEVQKNHGYGK